jgi:hypothetical protein
MIGDELKGHSSSIRLELSDSGQIVGRYEPSDPSAESDHPPLVMPFNHSVGIHAVDLPNGLFAGLDDWTHESGLPTGHGDTMSGRTVDEVMSHADDMAWSSSASHHMENPTETASEHSGDARVAPRAADAELEQVAEHAAPEMAQPVVASHGTPLGSDAIGSDATSEQQHETFEAVVAGWTTGQDSELAPVPGPETDPAPAVPSRGIEKVDAAADNLEAIGTTVFASFMTEVPASIPRPEESDGDCWFVFGAVLVSAAAGAGSFALNRRAVRHNFRAADDKSAAGR